MSRIRLVPVILIVLVSLGILFGAWRAYERFNLIDPLHSELNSVSGVQSVTIHTGTPTVIQVKLGSVKDLQDTYTQLMHKVSGAISGSENLVIVDNENDLLRNAYEETLFPIIWEGVVKGNYTEMTAEVNRQAQQMHINARVTMDEHNIYVQLQDGSHYLYKVVSYPTHQGGGTS